MREVSKKTNSNFSVIHSVVDHYFNAHHALSILDVHSERFVVRGDHYQGTCSPEKPLQPLGDHIAGQ